MASNHYDANIKLAYITDDGTTFASDTVTIGKPFDVIASVEIGKELMHQVRDEKLYVSIVNRSKATGIATRELSNVLPPSEQPYNAERRLKFPGGWIAEDGDVLEAIVSYKVSTGLFNDYSTLHSLPVIATDS